MRLPLYPAFTTLMAWGLMMFGAYTRLSDAGLGCPDWPACYGHWIAATGDRKAWIEMIHRYWAGALGLLSLGLIIQSYLKKRQSLTLPLGLILAFLFQAALGRWTVTLKLLPIVVMAHLMGGLLILSIVWLMTLQSAAVSCENTMFQTPRLQITLLLSLSLLLVQIALGGWVSAHYAALVCPDFPVCHRDIQSFTWSYKMTIHMLHRLGALLVFISISALCWMIRHTQPKSALALMSLLGTQITLGILNVKWILPMPIALAHQGVATLLFLLLLTFFKQSINMRFMQTLSDYLSLCKPRVVLLMLMTAWTGMLLGVKTNGQPITFFALKTALLATVGIGLCSSSAAVFNHWLDQSIDATMQRTHHRPLVQKRLHPKKAFIFGTLLGISGFILLYFFINPLTGYLTLIASIGYALIYSRFLKYCTPQNIVIGGITGALPPLLGWIAMCNKIQPLTWLPVLIIFAWTPPHFWALAIARLSDYQKARIPMLPVTHGISYTTLHILLYTLLLVLLSLLPTLSGLNTFYYFAVACLLGVFFLKHVFRLYKHPSAEQGLRTFRYSIVYLFCLFATLLFDRILF